jgi:Zn-dependent protease with chaperone function
VLAAAASVVICMVMSPIAGHGAGWLLPAVLTTAMGLGVFAATVGWHAYRHHRLSHGLRVAARPAMMAEVQVQEVAGVESAFVAGLLRPQIYCSPQLRARLRPDELRAVLLHERFHQLDRAPAKMVLLQAIAPALRFFHAGRAWLALCAARLEMAADRHALEHGSSRGALAGALLKLLPATTPGIGFTSAAELRLQALVDGRHDETPEPPPVAWLMAPVSAAILCFLMLGPI